MRLQTSKLAQRAQRIDAPLMVGRCGSRAVASHHLGEFPFPAMCPKLTAALDVVRCHDFLLPPLLDREGAAVRDDERGIAEPDRLLPHPWQPVPWANPFESLSRRSGHHDSARGVGPGSCAWARGRASVGSTGAVVAVSRRLCDGVSSSHAWAASRRIRQWPAGGRSRCRARSARQARRSRACATQTVARSRFHRRRCAVRQTVRPTATIPIRATTIATLLRTLAAFLGMKAV